MQKNAFFVKLDIKDRNQVSRGLVEGDRCRIHNNCFIRLIAKLEGGVGHCSVLRLVQVVISAPTSSIRHIRSNLVT